MEWAEKIVDACYEEVDKRSNDILCAEGWLADELERAPCAFLYLKLCASITIYLDPHSPTILTGMRHLQHRACSHSACMFLAAQMESVSCKATCLRKAHFHL